MAVLKFRFLSACFVLSSFVGAAFSLGNTPLQPEPQHANIAMRFSRQFPREHIDRLAIDDIISSRAWTNYLDSLDYDRSYFLQSDIARFRNWELDLDDHLKEGVLNFAYEAVEVFKTRVRERHEYVLKLLESPFDFTIKEVYAWDRKNAEWPLDKAEQDEIWRKRIKNEYLRQILMKESSGSRPTPPPPEEEPTGATAVLPTPEQSIPERYKQLLVILEDSDAEWVLQKYLSAFAQAYDPHSAYMSPSSVEDFDIEMKLSVEGIGALLRSEDGAAKIVRTIPGGPAELDKRDIRLRPGDKIIAIAQDKHPPVNVLHWPLHKVVRLIRGEKGTRVVLTVIPASDPTGATTKLVDLVRDEVKLEEQAASWKIIESAGVDGVSHPFGVVTLPTFYANMKVRSARHPEYRSAADDVAKALRAMAQKNIRGVLLDLRNNGGGSLAEAIKLAGLFIEIGPVVQVKEKDAPRALWDHNPSIVYRGPLVILVNRLSASASEIVAGALQDYGRALIVGDIQTHGKGTVQSILDVGRDASLGAIKITSAMYYRITGASTQKKGVSSDIVLPSVLDHMDVGEDSLPNAMNWSRELRTAYRPVANLSSIIPQLRQQSERRITSNPQFLAYAKLLDRINAVQKSKELPLDLEGRRKLVGTEKEILDLQAELEPEDGDSSSEKDPARPDPILTEGLHILADLASLPALPPGTSPMPPPVNRSFPQIISDWMKGL